MENHCRKRTNEFPVQQKRRTKKRRVRNQQARSQTGKTDKKPKIKISIMPRHASAINHGAYSRHNYPTNRTERDRVIIFFLFYFFVLLLLLFRMEYRKYQHDNCFI